MERHLTVKPISIQDENSAVHCRKVNLDGKSKISRPLGKKGGVAVENRKALNDITNKSSVHPEATAQSKKPETKRLNIVESGDLHRHVIGLEAPAKKTILNEKLNIVEEGFLHDHSKCIDAQKAVESELQFLNTVLPGHDSRHVIKEPPKGEADKCYPKLEELSMSEFSDWFESSWKSPPPSPLFQDCPLLSPFSWEFDEIELLLKEENYGDV